MKELTYKFQNPYNSCESVYFCKETNQFYILIPFTPYSFQLCTCTPHRGYYEADCPVKAGLVYCIEGKQVTTEAEGEIVDAVKKTEYENNVMKFYRIKPEFQSLPNYENFSNERLFQSLFDWMPEHHFDTVELKRKDVIRFLGGWYIKEATR